MGKICLVFRNGSVEFINVLRMCGFNLKGLFMRITFNLAFPRKKGDRKDIALS